MGFDIERAIALADAQHGLVTVAQLHDLGASRHAVAHLVGSHRVEREGRGVLRFVGSTRSDRQRLLAEVLGHPGAVASHRSALGLYGLPGFTLLPAELTIVRSRGVGRGIHRTNLLPAWHRRVVDGIPTTSLARALLDGTAVASPGRMARAMDTALARRAVSMPALGRIAGDCSARGRRRLRTFRDLVIERSVGYVPPESELEARFLELVERHGLPAPERQIDLGDTDGWIGRVDFYFREARIVVEVDGAEWHSSLSDRRNDQRRDDRFGRAGWTVARFRWTDVVLRPAHSAARLAALLEASIAA